jgi:hypothetical protein
VGRTKDDARHGPSLSNRVAPLPGGRGTARNSVVTGLLRALHPASPKRAGAEHASVKSRRARGDPRASPAAPRRDGTEKPRERSERLRDDPVRIPGRSPEGLDGETP